MENNFIFVIIVVIIVIIIIVAISNRGDEITHHHAKPHFNQPKNVMRIKTSKHIRSYKVFKVVMNDHSQVYKGHEVDNSTTKLVQVGEIDNTFPHGTDVTIPLDGEVNDHDPGQIFVEGTTIDGRIDTLATVSFDLSDVRTYTITFSASSPRPLISSFGSGLGPNTFHITVKPGSILTFTAPQSLPPGVDVILLNCGNSDVPCVVEDYNTYGPLGPSKKIILNGNIIYCSENGDICFNENPPLNENVSFGALETSVMEEIIFTITIDESQINQKSPCGTTPC